MIRVRMHCTRRVWHCRSVVNAIDFSAGYFGALLNNLTYLLTYF